MYAGFPKALIPTLLCPHDRGELSLAGPPQRSDGDFIQEGRLQCRNCRQTYLIEEGICRFLDEAQLTGESAREHAIRDMEAQEVATVTDDADPERALGLAHEAMEMLSTLEAVDPRGRSILELGCGTGRFTKVLAESSQELLALDFSLQALQHLARNLQASTPVGLVQGNVARFQVRPGRFDVVLSTLVSNLPTQADRSAMYALASEAIGAAGRFVFSTHHLGVYQRLAGEPRSGRYSEEGIYRHLFTLSEVSTELRRYFAQVRVRPIQIQIPLARRMGLPIVAVSRIAERIPAINLLGSLILGTAQRPRSSVLHG